MMNNTINGRTPEEIKRILRCLSTPCAGECEECEHDVGEADFTPYDAYVCALELIQQLERERDAAVAEVESLNAEIDAINEDYLSGIHTVREDARPKWISVEERLPEHNTAVIVAFDDGHVFQALYAYDGWDLWDGCTGKITHWMPLPEAPKEE